MCVCVCFLPQQLDDPEQGGPNMASVSHRNYGVNQALNRDYTGQRYDKGHLAPVYHQNSQSCSDATFTLTNAAPQHRSFNTGQWKKAEMNLTKYLSKKCMHMRVYIVTGVVAGNNINNKLNGKVQIPSHFWTAFCCLDNNNKTPYSGGYIGGNDGNNPVKSLTRRRLERKLSHLYSRRFTLFGGHC